MPNWIPIALLAIAPAFASPYFSMETLPGDMKYSKERGASFYEVRIAQVDSLRTVKRFWSGQPYTRVTRDSMPGTEAIYLTWYRCRFEVVGVLAGRSHPKAVPLIAVDSRNSAQAIWEKIWTEEERHGRTFILILEKNGQVKAVYQAKASLQGKDDMARKWKKSVGQELDELLENKDYEGYLYPKNLKALFKREGFDLD